MSNFQLIKQRPTRTSNLIRTIRKFFVTGFVISTFIAYVLHERLVNPEDRVDLVMPAQKIALQTQSVAAPVQPISAPPNDDSVVGQPDSPIQVAVANITATSSSTPTAIPATATETALPTVQPIVQSTVTSAIPSPTATSEPSQTPTEVVATTETITETAVESSPTDSPTDLPTATTEPTFTPRPTRTPRPTVTPTSQSLGMYKDGDYTGVESNAYYGLVQVQVTIQSGQIADVQFLEYPNHRRTSVRINQQAAPMLQSEALQVQSACVNMISGATLTSRAFVQSLQSALQQATTN